MARKSFAIALVAFFGLMAEPTFAMDDKEWWGAEIEGPSTIKMSAPGKEIIVLDIPDVTGLDGRVLAPVVLIESFPEEPENLQKYLKISADHVLVNSHKYIEPHPFFHPLIARPGSLKLVLNSQDVRESENSSVTIPQVPTKTRNNELLKKDATPALVKDILQQLFENIDKIEPIMDGQDVQGKLHPPIKHETQIEYVEISRIDCHKTLMTPQLFWQNIRAEAFYIPESLDEFKQHARGFIKLFNKAYSEKEKYFGLHIPEKHEEFWFSTQHAERWIKQETRGGPLPSSVQGAFKDSMRPYLSGGLKFPFYDSLAREVVLAVDQSAVSNGELLSLKVGSLQRMLHGNDTENPDYYCLKFY